VLTDRRLRRLAATAIAMAALILGTVGVSPVAAALKPGQLTFQRVVGGLSAPLGVVNAGDGTGRLFIVQRGGTVRVVNGRTLLAGTFLDVSTKVVAGNERGLLGLAFHPDFATNRRLFIYYTRQSDGALVISRLTANTAKTNAPSSSEVVLLVIPHPTFENHNGGSIAFGPDGYLYLGIGDGGSAGDPNGHGQDTGVLLGKILRIDVDGTGHGPNDAYGIPADNPFVGTDGLDEIWAYGVRNPWRISFDRTTHDLYIADVGQASWEEVDRQPAASTGGTNYGWKVFEGTHCYNASSCSLTGDTLPIAEYSHDFGCSIIGGYVYRGPSQHALQGSYVFGDICSGLIWTLPSDGTAVTQRLDLSISLSSFGESESGELYAVDLSGGVLYRVIAPEFVDIAASTFLDDIHWLFYAGLTKGCDATHYCPDEAVTRGQMASFLVRALGLPSTTTDSFDDDDGTTHEGDINRLAQAGITAGCGPRRFCPEAAVTRGEMASFLARGYALPPSATDHFTDDDGTTHEADIDRVAAAGITTGCTPTTYCPTASVTRGQMAAFLRRAEGLAD
jgi:Glucose / Sorbosone dehydrogenase/S-layer homology domain